MNAQQQTAMYETFFRAGEEYARAWKGEGSPETQTPEALEAAALQEYDAYCTSSDVEFDPDDYYQLVISAFERGFDEFVVEE